jgi:hypothetical protein
LVNSEPTYLPNMDRALRMELIGKTLIEAS